MTASISSLPLKPGGGRHLLRLGGVSERLLAEDVLAGRQRRIAHSPWRLLGSGM